MRSLRHNAAPGGFVQKRIDVALESFHRTTTATARRPGSVRIDWHESLAAAVWARSFSQNETTTSIAPRWPSNWCDRGWIPSSSARFRRERQTLARLQHPNISRLLDGGTPTTASVHRHGASTVPDHDVCSAAQAGSRGPAATVSGGLLGGRLRASQLHHPSRPEARQHPG